MNSSSILQTQKAAKIAGLLFILNLIVPLFNWVFILSPLKVENDPIASAKNILENEYLFRTGMTVELFMAIGLVLLALFLYKMLQSVNKNLALLAFSLKLIEAVLMAITVIIPLIALQFLNKNAELSEFTRNQLLYPIGVIFDSHKALVSVPMVFLGIDMMLFSSLFLKSRLIPPCIAGLGILSFALILIHALMFIVAPQYAIKPINQLIFWTPSGFFEIVAGLWLLIKGINTHLFITKYESSK